MKIMVLVVITSFLDSGTEVERWEVDANASSLIETLKECRTKGDAVIEAYGKGLFQCRLTSK